MRAAPCAQHSLRKCFTWSLKEGTMLHLVIDFQAVLGETTRKGVQSPDCQALWIDLAGQQPRDFARLGISSKLVEQFRVGCTKKALDHRTKAWLLSRTVQLRHEAPRQEGLKVDAALFRTTIDHQF